MTDNTHKARSLILAALMVFSVFAGTVALTGTAAAAQNVSLSVADDGEGAQTTHTFSFDASGASGEELDSVVLNYSGTGADLSGVSASDVNLTVDGTTYSGSDISQANGGGNGEILTVVVSSSTNITVNSSDAVSVEYSNIDNPSNSGEYDATMELQDDSQTTFDSGSASFTIGAGESVSSGDADANVDSGSTVWQGQTLFFKAQDGSASSGETYQVRDYDSDASNGQGGLETEFTLDSNGEYILETDDLDGDYVIVDNDGNTLVVGNDGVSDGSSNIGTNGGNAPFEVATQDFSTQFADDSVDNGGDTVETDLEFDSNRGSYDVEITGEADGSSLTDDELTDIFGSSTVSSTSDDSVEYTDATADSSITANFSGMDAGEYNFTVTVIDTTASDDASVTVNDVGAGSATLTESTTEVAQGDVGEVTVEFSGAASSGTLLIGDETEDGYQANISIADGNDDGEVTVEFNTYTAGNDSWTVVTPADSDDTANLTDQTELGSILESGDYQTAVSTGDVTTTMNSPNDLGTFYIAERMTTGAELWTAPGSTSASNLLDAVSTDDTIVSEDYLVVQLSASGLEGVVEAEGGLEAALDNGSIGMAAEQVNPGSNRAPKTLNVGNTNFETISDADNSTYYVAFKPSNGDFERDGDDISLAAGDEFNVSVSVQDDRLLGDDSADAHETVYHNFEIVAPSVSLDSTPVEVGAASGQEVTGTSTLAAGSEFTVRLRSSGDTEPRFFKTATATVAEDGTWTATFDFSDTSAGDTFTVSSSGQSPASALSADGEVVESTSTPTATATPEPDTETATATPEPDTETATATPEPSGEDTPTATDEPEDTTTTTTPGFGVAVALVALLAAALLAGRRE